MTTDGNNYGRIAAAEGIGTAVLMLGGPGVAILGGGTPTSVAVGGGLTLMILMYILGPASGAHVNPAVTLGMLVAKKISLRWAVTAWVAQIVGGIAGGAMILGIGNGRDPFVRGNFAANGYDRVADGRLFSGVGAVITVEVIFTALLVMVYLFAAHRRFAPSMVGVVAGATLTLGWLVDEPGSQPGRGGVRRHRPQRPRPDLGVHPVPAGRGDHRGGRLAGDRRGPPGGHPAGGGARRRRRA
jgi:aquaporin Z